MVVCCDDGSSTPLVWHRGPDSSFSHRGGTSGWTGGSLAACKAKLKDVEKSRLWSATPDLERPGRIAFHLASR